MSRAPGRLRSRRSASPLDRVERLGEAVGVGFRGRLAMLLGAVSLVAVTAAGWVMLGIQTRAIRQGLFEQSTRTAEILAREFTEAILAERPVSIRLASEEALRAQAADPVAPLLYVRVADRRARPLHASDEAEDERWLPRELHGRLTTNALARALDPEAPGRTSLEVVRGQDGRLVLDVGVPCAVDGVDGKTRVFGVTRIGVGLGPLQERWQRAMEVALLAAFGAVLLGLVVGALATTGMLRSIEGMSQAVARIAGGDLSPRIRSRRSDELGTLARAIDQMAEDLQKRELLKRYISASAWEEIEEKGTSYAEDHEVALKEVTVLFLDIRNYTSLSETYQSREIVSMLNEVFTVLIGVVDDFGGVLDKFIGDALLVVFYPGEENDDAVRAVYAGARMQEALREFSQKREFYGREAISIGVGINTGTVIAGSVGSRERKDYTVIGDPVNVAARLQERSKEGRHTRVVLSASTHEQVSSLVRVEPLEGASVRGKREEIPAFELVALMGLRGILDSLDHEDPQVRREAFQALEAKGGPVAIPHLVKVLGGDRQSAILKAIPILARLGKDSEAVARLLASLIEATDDNHILATAIRALGNLRGFTDIARLRDFLIHEDPRVRANTIEALDAVAGDRELDAIAPLLHDGHQRVKANAAVVLWKRGRKDVVRVLVALSRDGGAAERSAAVFAMGELFVSDAKRDSPRDVDDCVTRIREDLAAFRRMAQALVARLEDEDDEVVHRAVTALARARETSGLEALASLALEDKGEREAVLSALGRIGVPPRVARLLREWRDLKERDEARRD